MSDSELEIARAAEIKVYVDRYGGAGMKTAVRKGSLRASTSRLNSTHQAIIGWNGTGLIDVGCGTPRFTSRIRREGQISEPLVGIEPIPNLARDWKKEGVICATADKLPFPDKSFDFGTCFDCIEHLAPGDEEYCLQELKRVSRIAVCITISLKESRARWAGKQLHINLKPETEWDKIVARIFDGWRIVKFPCGTSPIWRMKCPRGLRTKNSMT